MIRIALASLLIALPAAAQTETFFESFSDGSNSGGWSFGTVFGGVQASGGNPGAYFRDPNLSSFNPQPRTVIGVESPFVGDYRARGVTSVGIDLHLFHSDLSFSNRKLAVFLINDNDTPSNFNDDWGAFFIGDKPLPSPGKLKLEGALFGWQSYDFEIPSASETLPEGWTLVSFGGGTPPDSSWNTLMQDVDQLIFPFGDPTQIYLLNFWIVGMDNPRITFAAPCPADLDGDGAVNGADLASLLANWNSPGGPEDLNGDGIVDGADLASLLASWGEVCPA